MTTTDMLDLVISNDRGGHETSREFATYAIERAPEADQVRSGIWTVEQAERFLLAESLKDWIEAEIDDMPLNTFQGCVRSQLVRCAFEDVDWDELARHYLDLVREG